MFVKNFGNGSAWLPGEIKEIRGPVLYTVMLNDGRSFKRHVDHIRVRTVTVPDPAVNPPDSILGNCLPPPTVSDNVLPNADPPLDVHQGPDIPLIVILLITFTIDCPSNRGGNVMTEYRTF